MRIQIQSTRINEDPDLKHCRQNQAFILHIGNGTELFRPCG
jgi:hypothetical protein